MPPPCAGDRGYDAATSACPPAQSVSDNNEDWVGLEGGVLIGELVFACSVGLRRLARSCRGVHHITVAFLLLLNWMQPNATTAALYQARFRSGYTHLENMYDMILESL